MITTDDVITSIVSGTHDSEFSRIYDAIKARRKAMAAGKTLLFKPKDRVRFNNSANPKYLIGLEGVVAKTNQTTVTVALGSDAGRFSNQNVRCPSSIIDKIA